MHAPRLDSIQLYSAAEHPALDWPETEEAQAVRQMFEPIAKDGFEQDFCNIHSQLLLLRLKNAVLPAMLCEGAYDDAFISNVVGQYTDYSRDELDSFDSKHLRWGAYAFLTVLKSALIRFQVNKCIAINNWPFASNLHPELSVDDLQAIKELCIERYPDHAVLFRSVNPELDAGLCFGLESCGFQEIFSRQVWMLNPDAKTLKIRHLKKDLQLLEDSPYRILKHHEIRQEDAPRLLELYSKLYIGKHSRCNVMFKQSFVERALRHRLLNFLALERDGRIDAVMAYVQNDRMVYTPFIGYDLELPQDLGLYRMASALLVKQALDLGLAVNHSAGAARFKKNRGAHGVIEQHYVFTEHLPTYRQAGWRVLRQIMNRLAVPMVKRMAI